MSQALGMSSTICEGKTPPPSQAGRAKQHNASKYDVLTQSLGSLVKYLASHEIDTKRLGLFFTLTQSARSVHPSTLSGRRQRSTASFLKELRQLFQGSGRGISWASLLSKMAWKAPACSAKPVAKPCTVQDCFAKRNILLTLGSQSCFGSTTCSTISKANIAEVLLESSAASCATDIISF